MKSKVMFKTSVLGVIVLFGLALIPGVAWAMLNPAETTRDKVKRLTAEVKLLKRELHEAEMSAVDAEARADGNDEADPGSVEGTRTRNMINQYMKLAGERTAFANLKKNMIIDKEAELEQAENQLRFEEKLTCDNDALIAKAMNERDKAHATWSTALKHNSKGTGTSAHWHAAAEDCTNALQSLNRVGTKSDIVYEMINETNKWLEESKILEGQKIRDKAHATWSTAWKHNNEGTGTSAYWHAAAEDCINALRDLKQILGRHAISDKDRTTVNWWISECNKWLEESKILEGQKIRDKAHATWSTAWKHNNEGTGTSAYWHAAVEDCTNALRDLNQLLGRHAISDKDRTTVNWWISECNKWLEESKVMLKFY